MTKHEPSLILLTQTHGQNMVSPSPAYKKGYDVSLLAMNNRISAINTLLNLEFSKRNTVQQYGK